MAGAYGEVVAEGALDVQLLQDHLAPFFDLLFVLAELLVLQLQGAPGSPVLELHFHLQLQVGQQLRLELQGKPGDVDEGAVVRSRAVGMALLVGAVIEAPVIDLAVAAQLQGDFPRGRGKRHQEQKAGGGSARQGSHSHDPPPGRCPDIRPGSMLVFSAMSFASRGVPFIAVHLPGEQAGRWRGGSRAVSSSAVVANHLIRMANMRLERQSYEYTSNQMFGKSKQTDVS